MKRFLKATLPLLALTGSMLIAQDDPDAKQPPEKGKESVLLAERIEAHFREHGFGLCAAELRRDRSFFVFVGLAVPDANAALMP